jgi:DNA polymerase
MILVGIDFETYYDREYSLRKLSMTEYLRDQRFMVHGAAVKVDGEPARWLDAEALPEFVRRLARTPGVVIYGHNVKFDGAILAWRYGLDPQMWIDTMGMSRAIIGGSLPSHSLDSVAKHLGLPGKTGAAALVAAMGQRQLSPDLRGQLASYAVSDIENTYQIMRILSRDFPAREYKVLDWTVRMFVKPLLVLNHGLLLSLRDAEIEMREKVLAEIQREAVDLRSNDRLAALLMAAGVDPPTKVSKRTGNVTWAFSAKDAAFVALKNHEDPTVAALVSARLSVKSSIEETRAAAYAAVAATGAWPVDLGYSGAMVTHRLSGGRGGGGNPQNLSRRSMLRKAIMAPEGYTLVVADSANIELRTSAGLCGQWDIVDTLVAGADLYAQFASTLFGRPVTKDSDPEARQVGKVAVLQLGYQSGAGTFAAAYWAQTGKTLDDAEAERIVKTYRATYRAFPATWKMLGRALKIMAAGDAPANLPSNPPLVWLNDRVIGPSGLAVKYPDLRAEESGEFTYAFNSKTTPTGRKKIYGGQVLENLSQFLAREIITEQVLAILPRYPVLMQVHDEVVVMCRENEADECAAFVRRVMSTPPRWWPRMAVSCSVSTAAIYGLAK